MLNLLTRCAAIYILLLLSLQSMAVGQNKHGIRGYIRDRTTQKPLHKAYVKLKQTGQAAEADTGGFYVLNDIPPGEYNLSVTMVGYRYVEEKISFSGAGQAFRKNFYLNPEILTMDEVITVTHIRAGSKIENIPASMHIIGIEDIELAAPQSLAEILDDISGIYVKDYGGAGGLKTVSLRGSSSEQVLILLDGQRLNDSQKGHVDLSTISPEGIEQIEVVRGGSSAVYGADAIGGVINIITRQRRMPAGPALRFDIMGGSFDSRAAGINFVLPAGNLSLKGGYRLRRSDGDYVYMHDGREKARKNNDVKSDATFLRAAYKFGDPEYAKKLEASVRLFSSRSGSPGTIEVPYYEARYFDNNQQYSLALSGKIINASNRFVLRAYANFSSSRYINDEGLVPVDSRYRNRAMGAELQNSTTLPGNFSLTYGAGYRMDRLIAAEFPRSPERQAGYGFMQGSYEYKTELSWIYSVLLVPSIRYDHYSDFGSYLSPRTGLIVNLNQQKNISFRFNAGFSYRAPLFNELYWPADQWAEGNPDLEAEEAKDWDAGLRLRFPGLANLFLETTYYSVRMSQMILWQSQGSRWTPLNVSRAHLSGIETGIAFSPLTEIIRISANYTYLSAKNRTDDRTVKDMHLVYRPAHTFNSSLKIRSAWFSAIYDFHYAGTRFTNEANTLRLPAYNTHDISLAGDISLFETGLKITLQLLNIFDKSYQIIEYQPVPGREVRIHLGVDLK